MPFDSNGVYSLPRNWQADAANAVKFSPELFMQQDADIAAALTALKQQTATPAQVQAVVDAARAALLDGVGASFDTFKEVAVKLGALDAVIAALQAAGSGTNATVATNDLRAQTAEALLIPLAQKAAANGVATLDATGKIPSGQLPVAGTSTVDWSNVQNKPGTFEPAAHNHNGVYDPAGSAAAHASLTNNPHSVTKAQVGLGSVDNTADAAKPVSSAQQAALDTKASKASETFTGNVVVKPSTTGGVRMLSGTATYTGSIDFIDVAGGQIGHLGSNLIAGGSMYFIGNASVTDFYFNKAIWSAAGGFKFPDNSVQTTAAVVPSTAISSELTFPASFSSVSFTHGLGINPTKVGAKFKCLTAEGGYAVGATIHIATGIASSSGTPGVWSDATTIKYVVSNGPLNLPTATGGNNFVPTPANWKVVLWGEK